MHNKILITLTVFFVLNVVIGQDKLQYLELIQNAESLYDAKDYKSSADKYATAFEVMKDKGEAFDRYNAARSFALSGNSDKAYIHLFHAAEGGYKNYNHILKDSDLQSLHATPIWDEIVKAIKHNKEKAEANYDMPLVEQLEKIYEEDQKYRLQYKGMLEKHGHESKEMMAYWKLINEKDSINLVAIRKILDERGWLGSDIVGGKGNSTIFMVIQHADLETQVKYLPMMKEAVKKGNARVSNLALLEDRVSLGQGNRQIYGSQISRDRETGEFFVSPLIDPENVDKRRAEVGLGPLAGYVKKWDITWDIEKHKKQTAKLEGRTQD